MICDRCYQEVASEADHGLGLCPLESRKGPLVIGDDIPGGELVYHGICNPDGTPKRYYTKSSMRDAAKAMGFENVVRHKGARGSDKNKNTVRWV